MSHISQAFDFQIQLILVITDLELLLCSFGKLQLNACSDHAGKVKRHLLAQAVLT